MTERDFAGLADRIEAALRACGAWRDDPPSEDDVLAGGAFGAGSVPFETWIQVVLLARLRAVARGEAEPPSGSSVAAYAVREWDGHPDCGDLLDLLHDLDAAVGS